jgi:hypothetical protein
MRQPAVWLRKPPLIPCTLHRSLRDPPDPSKGTAPSRNKPMRKLPMYDSVFQSHVVP